MTISRQVMIDQAYIELEKSVSKIQTANNLSNAEIELLLYKVISAVNTYKSNEYAKDITSLLQQLQGMQKKQNDYTVKEE